MRIVRQDISGTTDANGKAVIAVPLRMTGEWRIVKATLTSAALAEWSITLSGTVTDYRRGRRVILGPELLQPQESVTVTVTGGKPNDTVVGALSGVAGSADEIVPLFVVQTNSIALDTAFATADLGQVSDVNGVGTTKTLTLPVGTIALQILPGSNSAGSAPLGLTIRGTKSRDTYFFIPSTGAGGLATNPYYVISPQSGFEPQLDITVTAHAAQTDFAEIIALTAPVAQAAVITGVGTSGITSGGQDVSSNAASSIPVVPAKFYQPASWQAPLKVINVAVTLNQVGAGDTAVIIPAAFGQTVNLWDVSLSIDTAVATGAVQMETTAPVSIHQFGVSAVNANPFRGSGVPLAVGVGVQLRNLMGGNPAAMRGSMVYSQA